MAEVHGIGEAKLARYGQEFLAVIRQYQESA
jgi:superfamily II DNA helicase RecQ